MKTLKRLIASFVAGILSLPYLLFAQDEGTYIDNLGVQDSSYMEQDLLAEGAKGTGTGTIVIIIIVVIIIIAAIAYFIKKRKT
jgi:hypothetical protein